MTLIEAINKGAQTLKKSKIQSSELDSEVLMSFVLNKSKEYLYLNYNKKLSKPTFEKFWKLIKRRSKHEPVAYITGNKEFFGLDFKVNKNVLIPHPETELLVEEVINYVSTIEASGPNLTIADIGTGSGIIAISLKKSLPQTKIIAIDKSRKALKIAGYNATKHQAKITFICGDLLTKIKNKKINIIIANLPYLDKKEIKKLPFEIKKSIAYDPILALDGGKKGLELYNKLFFQINSLSQLPKFIACEINESHHKEITELAKKFFPGRSFEIKKDLAGLNRILIIK